MTDEKGKTPTKLAKYQSAKNIGIFITHKLKNLRMHRVYLIISLFIVVILEIVTPFKFKGTGKDTVDVSSSSYLYDILLVLLVIAVIAALVERLIEVTIALKRLSVKETLELKVSNHKRAWQVFREKDDLDKLFDMEKEILEYRSATRYYTFCVSFVLGAVIVSTVKIPMLGALLNTWHKYPDGKEIPQIGVLFVVGLLVAGGAQPLHDIISGIVRSAASLSRTKRVF